MAVILTSDGSRSQEAANANVVQAGNRYGDAYTMGHGDLFQAVLVKTALAADEGFVLIDLSDSANFPHTQTGKIRLYQLDIDVQRETTGIFIVYIGVITEVDATNGSTNWILALLEQTDDNPTDGNAKRHYTFRWPEGMDLEVSGSAMVNLVSNVGHSGDTTWQTDVTLDSPVGDTSNAPGPGDLVMFVDETTDGGTLDISVTATYLTEAT